MLPWEWRKAAKAANKRQTAPRYPQNRPERESRGTRRKPSGQDQGRLGLGGLQDASQAFQSDFQGLGEGLAIRAGLGGVV